jgi:hypothetical protein
MAKSAKAARPASYKSVGRTSDGVTILAPKTKATHFSKGELRSTVQEVRRKSATGQFETKSAEGRPPRAG